MREEFWSQLFLKHDIQRKKAESNSDQQNDYNYERQSKVFKDVKSDVNPKMQFISSGDIPIKEDPIEIPVDTTPTALFVLKPPSLTNGDKDWSVTKHLDKNFEEKALAGRNQQDYDDRDDDQNRDVEQSIITQFYPQPPILGKPKIKSVEAKCSKEAIDVRVTYDKPFDGIIYAKDHYSDLSCHFVEHRSGQLIFEFTLEVNRCGTTLVSNDYSSKGETVLENTLIFQNEYTFQEIWDSVRHLRCAWNGIFDKTVHTSVNVGILDSQTITYRGDSVESVMDVQYGHGLNAGPVQGYVRVGDDLTLSVSLIGSDANNFDVRVKDCIAHDGDIKNSVQLTDSNGCVVKKKLLGMWQKQRNIEDSSVTTFSYMQAFRFPEKMEVYFECNIEICKFECREYCAKEDTEEILFRSQSKANEESVKVRAKRLANKTNDSQNETNENRIEPIRLLRGIKVMVSNDMDFIEPRNLSSIAKEELMLDKNNNICLPISELFVTLFLVFVSFISLSIISGVLCFRYLDKQDYKRKAFFR